MSYKKIKFGNINNKDIYKHTLYNENFSFSISEYGACITNIIYKNIDVVAGFDNAEKYTGHVGSMGFTIGRYANRIANARFTLNNKTYTLLANNGKNHLHGGKNNISTKIFNVEYLSNNNESLVCTTFSKDGEEGYPGNLNLKVTFTLVPPSSVKIEYEATCDQDTIINLTNHSYFNLNGHDDGNIKNHTLYINSSSITESNSELIPTGNIISIDNTLFDFKKEKTLSNTLNNINKSKYLEYAGGLDHNFILNHRSGKPDVILKGDKSKITMNTYTTEPAVQIYTANSTNISSGKNNAIYTPHSLICVETQHYPDSINHTNFPSVILKSDDKFYSKTIYEFI